MLFGQIKSELAPTEDRGTIVGIAIAPEGSTIEYTDRYTRVIEGFYKQIPVVEKFFMVVGFPVVNQAISFVRLIDWDQRDVKQQQIVQQLGPKMFGVPGTLAFAVNPPSLGQSPTEKPIQFVIQTSLPYGELQGMVDKIMAEARTNPGLINVDSDLKLNKPELKVSLDRDKAADLGAGDRHDRPHAGNPAGRTSGHALQAERQAVRRDRPGRRRGPHQPGRHRPHLCARQAETRWSASPTC